MQITPIPPAVCDQLREHDDAGRPPVLSTDETGGAPLRCCLTRAQPGERIALVTYAPLRRWAAERGVDPGPYDEQGPVFLHAEPCPGPAAGWPTGLHDAPRVLRAYDQQGHILGGTLVQQPADAEATARELRADPSVAVLHVRAVGFGCFLHELSRA